MDDIGHTRCDRCHPLLLWIIAAFVLANLICSYFLGLNVMDGCL